MDRKVIVLTGATSGIGELCIPMLLKENVHLILIARNEAKAMDIIEKNKDINNKSQIDFIKGDLSQVSDLKKIAIELNQKTAKIDVLLNNAGIFTMKREVNTDGIEVQFMVNFVAPRYLALQSLHLLKKSTGARIINVSSRMHRGGKINFDDLQLEKKYSGAKAYSNTKLAIIVHTFALAKKLQGSNISTFALHPGVYATGISRHMPAFAHWVWNVLMPNGTVGAKILKDMALSDTYKNANGKYFFRRKEKRAKEICYDLEVQQKLEEYADSLIK